MEEVSPAGYTGGFRFFNDEKKSKSSNIERQTSVSLQPHYQRLGYGLVKVTKSKKNKNAPSFEDVLAQPAGVFLINYVWHRGGESDWHVICVDCDQRRVLCNSFGIVIFKLKPPSNLKARESQKTHAAVKALFMVNLVTDCWCVIKTR